MTWNHRIVAQESGGETIFQIHEVYYDEDNKPTSWTKDPINPCGDSVLEIRGDYEMMRLAFFRPALRVHAEGDKSVLRPEAPENVSLNDYYRHEALDRTSVFAEQFESHVACHPVIELSPDLRKQAEEIADRLGELYLAIGQLFEVTSEERAAALSTAADLDSGDDEASQS